MHIDWNLVPTLLVAGFIHSVFWMVVSLMFGGLIALVKNNG